MRIYIDSNTFPAAPGLYADAAKTKPIPRMIPAVELQRGGFEVAFVGSNQPRDIASVSLVASIDGAGVQVIAEQGEDVADDSGDAWRFDFALNAESLVAEIAKRGSARLRVGVIVEDDTERREWQFSTVVYPSASSEETDTVAVESAKNFAELAQRAAMQATEAQESVAGNAQLAESAKQTATQASNSAIEAADDAEVSERNAAESKEAAEQAKTDAEAAKADAKKAASDAQATLGNVYTKAEIDGVDTGAELTDAMNKAHEWLASVSGKLPPSLYESLLEMLRLWSLNPTSLDFTPYINEIARAVAEWQDDPSETAWAYGDGSSPYEGVNIDTALVDFKVKVIKGLNDNVSRPIGIGSSGIFILPNVEELDIAFRNFSKMKFPAFAPKAKRLIQTYRFTYFSSPIFANEAINVQYFVQGNSLFNSKVFADKAEVAAYAFSGCTRLDQSFSFVALKNGTKAFERTAMSPKNIAATLDSLPERNDGESHSIFFSRADGTLLAPLMAESPYKESVDAAVARGWTVQFDI